MQFVPHNRQIIGGNKQLHPEIRQRMVLLRFREPLPKHMAWEFLRIRLDPRKLAAGEPDGIAHIVDPIRMNPKPQCELCSRELQHVGGTTLVCNNPKCRRSGVMVEAGKPRGVVNVVIPSDCIDDDGRTSVVVLQLDREYPEDVLAHAYRTAGVLCDMMGWRLK